MFLFFNHGIDFHQLTGSQLTPSHEAKTEEEQKPKTRRAMTHNYL